MMTANTTALSERFAEAFNLALNLHGDQIRKGSDIPYVAHLMSVAASDEARDAEGDLNET